MRQAHVIRQSTYKIQACIPRHQKAPIHILRKLHNTSFFRAIATDEETMSPTLKKALLWHLATLINEPPHSEIAASWFSTVAPISRMMLSIMPLLDHRVGYCLVLVWAKPICNKTFKKEKKRKEKKKRVRCLEFHYVEHLGPVWIGL